MTHCLFGLNHRWNDSEGNKNSTTARAINSDHVAYLQMHQRGAADRIITPTPPPSQPPTIKPARQAEIDETRHLAESTQWGRKVRYPWETGNLTLRYISGSDPKASPFPGATGNFTCSALLCSLANVTHEWSRVSHYHITATHVCFLMRLK